MRKYFFVFLGCTLFFLVAGCAPGSHFGVEDKAYIVPDQFDQTEAAIAAAEKSAGAKYCPDKIAKAKELGTKAAETYWRCRTDEAMAMLAEARKLAKEAESCRPPAAPAPPPAARPAPAPAPAPKKEISLKWVYFDFDKYNLKPEAKATLDEVAKTLRENPDIDVELAGHTDGIGTEAYNMKLSQRRAQAVLKYLNSQGIPASRLKVTSFGKTKPVADNKTKVGRAKNRRVEISVLK